MGNKEVSIVFKASDRLSESIKGMRGGVKGLSADVEAYRKLQKQTFEEKAKVKLDITEAKAHLKELEKAVKSGAEGAKEAFLEQQTALEALNEEYKRLNSLQNEATRAEKELSAAFSKSSNAAGRGGVGMLGALAQAGLGNMLGGAVGDLLGSTMTSALGSTVGGAVENIGGNAITGAAMGSMLGPYGAAIGAAVGGLTGAIQSLTDYQKNMDGYFQEEVRSLYQDTMAEYEARIHSGSEIAAERESLQRSYNVMAGSAGDNLYQAVLRYGDTTPYDTTAMLNQGMDMLRYGVGADKAMEMMEMIGNIAMGDTNAFSGLSYQIAQSMSTGIVNAADLKSMQQWGFNPLEYVAKNQGITEVQARELVSAGQLTADVLIEAMRTATNEGERFYQATSLTADTYSGMMGQLESAWANIEAGAGEVFNAKKGEGIAKEISMLTGETGDMLKDAYAKAAEYEAEMENQRNMTYIKTLEDAASRVKEEGLVGMEAAKMMWEAKAAAEIEYKNSEEFEMRKNAEVSLVARIQEELGDTTYWQFGQKMAEQFSKGWQSTRLANASADIGSHVNPFFAVNGSHANGLDYVPFDGYIARLHEGERVLTKEEARSGGKSVYIGNINLTEKLIVSEKTDIDEIARALVTKLIEAEENYVGG